jgi:guanyl-specific ribonuclease Sa
MRNRRQTVAMLAILALAAALVAGFGSTSGNAKTTATPMAMAHDGHGMQMTSTKSASKAVALRIALDRLLGEHAILAIQATQRGLAGGKDFPAIAKQLDANSVALSQAIASVYGQAAGKQFLNGKFLWRDHIKFFVNYTVATAKGDKAGQQKAVANLMTYVQTQAAFFAKATGLPKQALVDDLTAHILQLKGQLDAYAKGDYAQSYSLTDAVYKHMFMTGDALAAGIAKQKGLGSTTSKTADLQVTLDRMLGEHALLATWATQAGVTGGKNFPALAKQLDRNSVEISQAIGSVYGAAAAKQFLNGKNLWRSHINNFVQYTVATAKADKAGQKRAVTSLLAYVQAQAAFFAKETGLPKQAVVNDLTAHVLQLKAALDSYHAGQYGTTFELVHGAYEHMFMTGADLAGGIAKQKGLS